MAVASEPSLAVAPNDVVGSLPTKRLTRDQLVKTHQIHLEKYASQEDAPRQVKQLNMGEMYHASTKSIRELEIVRQQV